jgi:hypothetical protein
MIAAQVLLSLVFIKLNPYIDPFADLSTQTSNAQSLVLLGLLGLLAMSSRMSSPPGGVSASMGGLAVGYLVLIGWIAWVAVLLPWKQSLRLVTHEPLLAESLEHSVCPLAPADPRKGRCLLWNPSQPHRGRPCAAAEQPEGPRACGHPNGHQHRRR